MSDLVISSFDLGNQCFDKTLLQSCSYAKDESHAQNNLNNVDSVRGCYRLHRAVEVGAMASFFNFSSHLALWPADRTFIFLLEQNQDRSSHLDCEGAFHGGGNLSVELAQ